MNRSDDWVEPFCRSAGLDFDQFERVDWGLSANLWVISRAGQPIAVVKQNRGFPGRFHAELSALSHLQSHNIRVPTVLGSTQPDDASPALILSWIEAAQRPSSLASDGKKAALTGDWYHHAGVLVAELHQVDGQRSDLRLANDPLPLGERLVTQAQKSLRRVKDEDLGSLGRAGLQWMLEQVEDHKFDKHVVHRDLRPENFVNGPSGCPVGLVDFEHAAATDPAWDFAKISRWLAPSLLQIQAFETGYSTIRNLPSPAKRTFFEVHESVSMLGFFETRNPEYVRESAKILKDILRICS